MYQGEESEQVLESFEKERERLKLSSERRKSADEEGGGPFGETVVEVVSEAQNKGENRKRPRGLSYIDSNLRFKGISSSHKGQLEILMFDHEMIEASIDERSKGWDSYKWWQGETQKSDKAQFLLKFQALALRSTSKSKRISVFDHAVREREDIHGYGAIEKHRGEHGAGVEYNNVDLGFDHFEVGDEVMGSPSGRRFRGGRDTIESSVNYFGEGLNSSDGGRLHSGRESMIFSDSRRGSSVGLRLSTMLEGGGGSGMSYNSSPFQFERSSLIGGGAIQRDCASSELRRVIRDGGRLSGSIGSGGGKHYRTSSIATSVSDIFYLEEIKSSNWSKSGITTSSGTYNLKTYTVQKFIASKMKEIREIREINKENGYLLNENCSSNKENNPLGINNIGEDRESGSSHAKRDGTDKDAVFDENDEEMSIYLNELLPEKNVTRGTAAVFFYHLLVLATYNEIKLSQNTPGGNIKITKTCSFNEES